MKIMSLKSVFPSILGFGLLPDILSEIVIESFIILENWHNGIYVKIKPQ